IQFSIYEPPSFELLRWLRQQQILPVAAASLNPEATAQLNPMKDPHVRAIAAAVGRSPAQVLLRWVMRRAAVLPRSRSPQHIRENGQLDFSLSSAQLAQLDGLCTLVQSRQGALRPPGAHDVYGLQRFT
ncbi:unnamed protein product, partial [Effrenium voratum]